MTCASSVLAEGPGVVDDGEPARGIVLGVATGAAVWLAAVILWRWWHHHS
jgi:hypothetical protein